MSVAAHRAFLSHAAVAIAVGCVSVLAGGCASKTGPEGTPRPQGRVEVRTKALKPDPAKLKEMGLRPSDLEAPVPLSKPDPEYPASALKSRVAGTVSLRCVIQSDGSVSQCEVTRPLTPECDAAAVKAVETWKYTPTKMKGVAVPAYVDIGVNYVLN